MSVERENLKIETDIENGKSRMLIDPVSFTVESLREILRYQIYSQDPREILIVRRGHALYVPFTSIRKARTLFGEKRRYFLNKMAEEMYQADTVILQEPK